MPHHAAYAVPLEQLSVAVVDDIAHMTDLFRIMLGAINVARIQTFNDVKPFIHHGHKEPPHLLITDLAMEPTSGFDLIKFVRQTKVEPLCHAAIVAVSAHATRENIRQSLLIGANAFLAKPLSANTLRDCLERVTRDPQQLIPKHTGLALTTDSTGVLVDDENIQSDERDDRVFI